jgi:translation initiation factor IF-2
LATTKVYLLAKELGVKSTAIIKKCQNEGLDDVKNHMTTISAGLAATIREWFSDGEHITAEETAEKVDLQKVRIKKKPKAQKPEQAATALAEPTTVAAEETGAGAALIEPEAKIQATGPAIVQPEIPALFAAKAGVGAAEGEAVIKQPVTGQPAKEPAVKEEAAQKRPAKIKGPVKPKPEQIKPAGPMLEKPKPAKLAGPRVVRVEAVEPLQRPRPRPRYDKPLTQPLIDEQLNEGLLAIKGKKVLLGKHPRHKEREHVDTRGELLPDASKKAKYLTIRRQRDIEERRARLEAAGGERLRIRPVRKIATKAEKQVQVIARPTKAEVAEPITIKNLSAALAAKSADIIAKLMEQGILATANEIISNEVAELVAMELGCELTIVPKKTLEDQIRNEFENRDRKNLAARPVVATMLGHVDHGKTSLLDKIRLTNVAGGEAGGITQHIGAYQAKIDDSKITFLDTPGHEAFTAMRARGATMTDVVVIVVAADDGVMQQTIEAIAHSKAAAVPVIVALNKIDLPGIDTNRIYAQLAEHGLIPTEWGGETDVVKTSALTGQGITDLLEHINYVRDLLALKADDTIPATGWVVEAKMSAQRGAVVTLLVREGVLNKGDCILAGATYGRVKSIRDSFDKNIKTATSAMPVEITGLSGIPQAGDRFYCLGEDINKAKQAADENLTSSREKALAKRTQITLENLFSQIEAGNVKELNIILRADVQGSVDVLTKYLAELSREEVKIKILQASTGGVTEGDVILAEASNAIIIAFSVVADDRVAKIAETKGVDIRYYNIIYRITEDLKKSMAGLLEPEKAEKTIGRAVVRQTFRVSKIGTVAGCYVSDGLAKKSARVRLIRDNVVIRNDLVIESLKHFKDDAREVKAGLECGINLAKHDDIKVDDLFEFYEVVQVKRTLE